MQIYLSAPFLRSSALKYNIIPHSDPSDVGKAHFFTLKASPIGNQSLSVLMFLLCAAFFTLPEAICDPAGAMLAQTLHPQGAIVALETSAGSHLGQLSKTPPALTCWCVFLFLSGMSGYVVVRCSMWHPAKHVALTHSDIHLQSITHPISLLGLLLSLC